MEFYKLRNMAKTNVDAFHKMFISARTIKQDLQNRFKISAMMKQTKLTPLSQKPN